MPVPPREAHSARGKAKRKRKAKGPIIAVTAGGTALALAVTAGGINAAKSADSAAGTASLGEGVTIPAGADTYVVKEKRRANFGSAPKITASHWKNWRTEAYVSFTVPPGLRTIEYAKLEFTFEKTTNQPATVELRSVPTAGWSEGFTNWGNRPRTGSVLTTADISAAGARTLSFDVSDQIRGPGTYSFALTNPDYWSAAALHSRERGDTGPRLTLTVPGDDDRKRPAPTPSRTVADPGPAPTKSAPPSSRPSPVPSRPPSTAGRTLCGASFNVQPGETFQQALRRVDDYYGGLDMVRVFYADRPSPWPGKINAGTRPVLVSFKLSPKDVLAGKHDAYMREWFKSAPRDRDIYWTYYHEPEDNIADGEFSAADYRAAWRRLRSLADSAGSSRLRATLVLMSWSLLAESKRNWRDYYPGRDVIQVLGWDTYNLDEKKGRYEDPVKMYDEVIALSKAEKLPFGVAETGSHLVGGDTGAKRAAWLRDMIAHLKKHDALWVAYFDLDWSNGDYRLTDRPSRQAWQDFC